MLNQKCVCIYKQNKAMAILSVPGQPNIPPISFMKNFDVAHDITYIFEIDNIKVISEQYNMREKNIRTLISVDKFYLGQGQIREFKLLENDEASNIVRFQLTMTFNSLEKDDFFWVKYLPDTTGGYKFLCEEQRIQKDFKLIYFDNIFYNGYLREKNDALVEFQEKFLNQKFVNEKPQILIKYMKKFLQYHPQIFTLIKSKSDENKILII